ALIVDILIPEFSSRLHKFLASERSCGAIRQKVPAKHLNKHHVVPRVAVRASLFGVRNFRCTLLVFRHMQLSSSGFYWELHRVKSRSGLPLRTYSTRAGVHLLW